MNAPRTTVLRRVASLVALGALLATSLLAGTALAATTTKPYNAEITGHAQRAGTTVGLTITITNNTSPQSMGSANWTLPAEFTGVQLGARTSGTVELAGRVIKIRTMNLLPFSTFTLQLTAIMPCDDGTYSSSVIAKQSNDFSGPPGNDFTPTFPPANLQTTVSGSCQLAFQFAGQPANAEVDAKITTVTYLPSGAPVKVALLDDTGALAPNIVVPVGLGIGTNPAGGHLAGGAAVNTVNGYATFPNISIDAAGLGYTLNASSGSAGVTAGPSASFNVMNLGKICDSGPCSGSTTGEVAGAVYTVDAVAGAPGDRLDIGISLEDLNCADYDEQTDVVTFNVFSITETESTRTKTLTMQFRPDPKAPKNVWRVCYSTADPAGFTDRSGNHIYPAGTSESVGPDEGLLPDCVSDTDAPCMVSVTKVGKDIKIILRAPAGDPKGRG